MTVITRSARPFGSLWIVPFLVLGLTGFFGACSSFSVSSSEESSWAAEQIEQVKGSIQIISVSVERSGEWGSLEKEITGLLPLLFLEEFYLVVPSAAGADYSAGVIVREREYPDGWQIRRSLSVEVRLWAGNTDEPLPLTAGRSLSNGRKSLASSKTLSSMLRKAIKGAIGGLPGPVIDPPGSPLEVQ